MTPQDQTAETRAQVMERRVEVAATLRRLAELEARDWTMEPIVKVMREAADLLTAPVAREPQPTMAGHGVNWMVVRQRECDAPEVWSFDDEQTARTFHEQAQTQWTNCALTRVVKFGAQADRPAREEPSAQTPALDKAIWPALAALVGVSRIQVEADPLYGIKAHERWYPKSVLVDTDSLMALDAAWRRQSAPSPRETALPPQLEAARAEMERRFRSTDGGPQ